MSGLLVNNMTYPSPGNNVIQQSGSLLGNNMTYPPPGNNVTQQSGGLLGNNMTYPPPGNNVIQKTDVVIKPPMCAGGKIQLPRINRSSVMTVKSDIKESNNIPKIHSIADTTINNKITEDDLCYNRCPNGEAPIPDFFSGQYMCLVPASVTYTVTSGKGSSPDPTNTDGTDDTIDYSKGYNVSCQSTDIINLGESGIQTGNENNIMFGTPVLLKSSLYEDPLPSNSVRSSNFIPNGNPKWFCKRPVFGSPTINQVQSPYNFVNSSVINNSTEVTSSPEILNKALKSCAIPTGGWGALNEDGTTNIEMPDFCKTDAIITKNQDSDTITTITPGVNSLFKAIAANINSITKETSSESIIPIDKISKPNNKLQTTVTQAPQQIECSQSVDGVVQVSNDARCNPESSMMVTLTGGLKAVNPISTSVNSNTTMNVVSKGGFQISVPKTETTVTNVDGGVATLTLSVNENNNIKNTSGCNPQKLNISQIATEPIIQITTISDDDTKVCDIQVISGNNQIHKTFDGKNNAYLTSQEAKDLVSNMLTQDVKNVTLVSAEGNKPKNTPSMK